MPDILSVADHADMIVNGYAFSKSNDSVRVLNLNNPASACVLSVDGKVLETTMDDIELSIVQDYYSRNFKICGYYLYFTAHCIIECMHVHASDRKLTEGGSAKFFVKSNGDTVIQNRGVLTDRELSKIQSFIKDNYKDMYLKWASMSENGFFGEN